MSWWKFFLAKSTAPVFSTKASWLAYVWVDTSPCQAGWLEKVEDVDLAKKIFIYKFCLKSLWLDREVNRKRCERA